MKALLLLVAVAPLALASHAAADEAFASSQTHVLKVRVKSAMESTHIEKVARAPFAPIPGDPMLALVPTVEDPRLQESRSSCSKGSKSLCYDQGTGKIVYKKTREYMPEIPGLTPEHISVRRDRITFKYSFQ